MTGQMRNQMRLYADWTHAWAATAMRDAECFVQIQVAYIAANITWTGQSDHGVHISAINVNLTAKLMRDCSYLMHCFLKHPMC